MSPYMRAYEQGIKLAQYKWLSKYANPEQGLSLDEEFMPAEGSYTLDSQPMTNLRADYDFEGAPPEVPRLSDKEYAAIGNNARLTAASGAEIPYEDAPTTVGAGDNYRDLYDQVRADAVMRGDASPEDFEGLDYMDMRDAMGARMLRPGDTFDQNAALDRLQNMGEFREGLRPDFANVATSENIPVLDSRGRYAARRMLTQTQQGRNPMTVSPIASDELFGQELAKELGETSPAPANPAPANPAPANPAPANPAPANPAPAPSSPLAAPVVAPQAAAGVSDPLANITRGISDSINDPSKRPFPGVVEQGRLDQERIDNTFNVQSGGYGKQLRRFRNQFGEGNDALFTGDDAVNYRQFAQAMDNRGLQVGDTFDARNVLDNLRAMRQEDPIQKNLDPQRVGVQRRGRDAGFQTMQQQRAAADRIRAARASAAGNIPQLKTTAMSDLPTLAQSPNTQTVELPQRATIPAATPRQRATAPAATPRQRATTPAARRTGGGANQSSTTSNRGATRSLAAAEETPDLSTFQGRADQRVTGRGVTKGRFSNQEGNRGYNVELDGLSERQGADIVAGGRKSRKIPTLHGRVDNAFDSLP